MVRSFPIGNIAQDSGKEDRHDVSMVFMCACDDIVSVHGKLHRTDE